jgi:hypothetical protein
MNTQPASQHAPPVQPAVTEATAPLDPSTYLPKVGEVLRVRRAGIPGVPGLPVGVLEMDVLGPTGLPVAALRVRIEGPAELQGVPALSAPAIMPAIPGVQPMPMPGMVPVQMPGMPPMMMMMPPGMMPPRPGMMMMPPGMPPTAIPQPMTVAPAPATPLAAPVSAEPPQPPKERRQLPEGAWKPAPLNDDKRSKTAGASAGSSGGGLLGGLFGKQKSETRREDPEPADSQSPSHIAAAPGPVLPAASSTSRNQAPPPPPPVAAAPRDPIVGKRGRCHVAFQAENPGELTITKGDVVVVTSRVNDDWLEGQSRGYTGIFPAAFITIE